MTTVLEKYTTKEQRSVVRFYFWANGLNAKDIHEDMLPVYGGKCFRQNDLQLGRDDDEEVETKVRNWLRQPSKDFYAAGFDALVKHDGG
jgi:hypothetical protein